MTGTVLLPDPVPSAPLELQPTMDARAACAAALAEYLRCAVFRRGGGTAAATDFQLAAVLDEWPEPDVELQYPSASVIDDSETVPEAHALVPTPLEETYNPETGVVLWKLAEAVQGFQVDFWATDAPTREAIAARLPALFVPGEGAYGVVLQGPVEYLCRPVRATLVSYQRMDLAEAVYPRERRLQVRIRCEVDVIQARCDRLVAPTVSLTVGEDVEPACEPGGD